MADKIKPLPMIEPSPALMELAELMRHCVDEIRKVAGIDDLADLARHERRMEQMFGLQFYGHSLGLVKRSPE